MLLEVLARVRSLQQPGVYSLFDRLHRQSIALYRQCGEQLRADRLLVAHKYGTSPERQHGSQLALDLEDPSLLPKVRREGTHSCPNPPTQYLVLEAGHHGLQVALIGRPNVGKSALFNRLIRRKAALVGIADPASIAMHLHEVHSYYHLYP
jgi:hypothetical protein